jgi:hypothetical protein
MAGRKRHSPTPPREILKTNQARVPEPTRRRPTVPTPDMQRPGTVPVNEMVRVEPGSAEAHHNLGLAQAGSNRNPEAIEQFQMALKNEPDFAFAQYNLGIALALAEGR